MAKISVSGDAVTITSSLKFEDIKMVSKYRKSALTLMGGEDGKTPVFAVSAVNGLDSASEYGISFGRGTRDDDGFAYITAEIPSNVEDVKEFIADKFGNIFTNLKALEETVPAVITAIKNERKAVMDCVEGV